MAEENQDGQEKTEEPSQRKIDKYKEDGKVLTSKEMFVFTGIAGALLLMYAFSFYSLNFGLCFLFLCMHSCSELHSRFCRNRQLSG